MVVPTATSLTRVPILGGTPVRRDVKKKVCSLDRRARRILSRDPSPASLEDASGFVREVLLLTLSSIPVAFIVRW